MFTGLVKELGTVKSLVGGEGGIMLSITAELVSRLYRGASVSINGACQTVISLGGADFSVFATAETLRRTNLGLLGAGDKVNLELPLTLDSPIGGHLVQGHVDTMGHIVKFERNGHENIIIIGFASEYGRYLVEKGSVAVDGISLTCFEIGEDSFKVALIPETINNTNLQYRKPGQKVNLEFDLLAKYVEKMTVPRPSKVDWEFLREHGFER